MYEWTQKYVGIPFVSGGRTEQGLDCYGLIRLIHLNEYNIELPLLNENYEDALNAEETKDLFGKYIPVILGHKIELPEEKAICLMRTSNRLLTHVGMYAGDGFIIHARNKTGVVCERINSPLLTGRIEGWYHVGKSYNTTTSILQ